MSYTYFVNVLIILPLKVFTAEFTEDYKIYINLALDNAKKRIQLLDDLAKNLF